MTDATNLIPPPTSLFQIKMFTLREPTGFKQNNRNISNLTKTSPLISTDDPRGDVFSSFMVFLWLL